MCEWRIGDYVIVITVSFCGSRTSGSELAPVHSLKMSTTKMAGMAPQGNGNGQSNLSSPASSRRLPMLRAETVSLASLGVLYFIIVILDDIELAKKIEGGLTPSLSAGGCKRARRQQRRDVRQRQPEQRRPERARQGRLHDQFPGGREGRDHARHPVQRSHGKRFPPSHLHSVYFRIPTCRQSVDASRNVRMNFPLLACISKLPTGQLSSRR